jgi:hypothetical protein
MLEKAPKGLFERKLLDIYPSKLKEKVTFCVADDGDDIIAPRQEVRLSLSLRLETEKEKLCCVPEAPDLKLAPENDPRRATNNRFSWESNYSRHFTASTRTESVVAAVGLDSEAIGNQEKDHEPDRPPILSYPYQLSEMRRKRTPSFETSPSPSGPPSITFI